LSSLKYDLSFTSICCVDGHALRFYTRNRMQSIKFKQNQCQKTYVVGKESTKKNESIRPAGNKFKLVWPENYSARFFFFLLFPTLSCSFILLHFTNKENVDWDVLRTGERKKEEARQKLNNQELRDLYSSPINNITYLLTYGAETFLRSCQLCSHSEISQQF
jgi:hypothetical protein